MERLNIYGGWLTVNRYCNFRCNWCYAKGTNFKPTDNMSLGMAKDLVDLMYDVGIRSVTLIGGETLFWPHLFDITAYMRSLEMTSVVVTNGWLLGFPKFLDRVKHADIDTLHISLKAGDKATHKAVTGFDGFDRVLAGMRAVQDWKQPSIEYSTVINTHVPNYVDIVRLAFEHNANGINLTICNPTFTKEGINSECIPNGKEFVEGFVRNYEDIQQISSGRFILESSIPACLWPREFRETLEERGQITYGCHFKTRSGLILDKSGAVLPCNHLCDFPLGQYRKDFANASELETLLLQEDISRFYDTMIAYPSVTCTECSIFDTCGGGCPLQWFVHNPTEVIPSQIPQ